MTKDGRFIFLDSVSSTNEEAKRLGREGAEGGAVVAARRQTAGRGRLGRTWESPEGALLMSMIVMPDQNHMDKITRISLAAGVAVLHALDSIFEECSIAARPGLGWPNDLLVDTKKIAGILCEAVLDCDAPFVVIGIGININNRVASLPEELRKISTSVADLGNSEYSIRAALEKTALMLDNRIPRVVERSEEWSDTLKVWRERCVLIGREVMISSPGVAPEKAVPTGIDDEGRLIIKTQNGRERAVEFEETTLSR